MTNELIIADLHVDDYKLYNPSPHYRLHQPDLLADRILRLASELGSTKLFILGDLLNHPIVVPRILHSLKNFLEKVTTKLDVYYIVGQHDCDGGKQSDIKFEETLVNALGTMNGKLHYYHNQFMQIEDCTIYMRNWTNVSEYPIPEVPIDIYLSHLSLGFGQAIDDSKFQLGIFGDIHEPVQYGNCYSVSTPYQHYPSQPEQGYIGILTIDGKKCSFKRVPSDDDKVRFLRLKETDQYKANLFKNEENVNLSQINNRVDLTKSIYDQIIQIVKEHGLEDIHSQIPEGGMPNPIDFNFRIQSVHIENFKSIEKLDLNVSQLGKVIFLSGHNGSGKSATIEAIITGLLGDRQIRKYNRIDKDNNVYDCLIDLTLWYNNKLYRIARGPGYTEFWEDYANNETSVSKNNKNALESYIYEELPFLGYLYFFIVRANSHFFNNCDRTELIKTCFNIFIFDYLIDQGKQLRYDTNVELSNVEAKLALLDTQIKSVEDNVTRYQATYDSIQLPQHTKDEINQLKSKINDSKRQLELIWNSKVQYTNELNSLNSWNTFDTSKVDDAKSDIEYYTNLSKYENALKTYTDNINRLKNSIEDIKHKIEYYQSNLTQLIDSRIECPRCHEKFSLDDSQEVKYTEIINNLNDDLINKTNELNKSALSVPNRVIFNLPSTESPRAFNSYKDASEYLIRAESKIKALNRIQDVQNEITRLDLEYSTKSTEFVTFLQGKKSADFIAELDKELELLQIKENSLIQLNTIKQSKENLIKQTNEITIQQTILKNKINKINEYISLFDISDLNSITYSIIKQVTSMLNSDTIRFETTRELASGEQRFNVSASINIQGCWRDYDSASDGQKCILDLYIINKIISLLGNVGLLIMDESLANIDSANYELASEFLKTTPATNILITSHSTEFTGEDNRINYELVNGISQILIS